MTNPAIGGIRLVLGGNQFGWTADRTASFAVLDAFVAGGGRMIDTAEGYSNWVPGHVGGESETMIGEWLKARGARDRVLIHTKVGMGGEPGCLARARVEAAIDGSLRRLGTDYVDLYYAHRDDLETPQAEVIETFTRLIATGKIRAAGASNFTAERLASALDAAAAAGVPGFSVLQPQYNLVERDRFEGELQQLCVKRGIAALPYFGLALGFLTGKYRKADDARLSVRGGRAAAYLNGKGASVLATMDAIVSETGATHAQIALAWMNTRAAVAAPIAGARTAAQVDELIGAARLALSDDQLARLEAASA